MARRKVELDLQEVLQLYNDKEIPFKEKAKMLGVSPDTLRNFLRNNGVNIPICSGPASDKLSVEKVTDLYVTQNMSRKETAKELGVSLSTLGRFIAKNKIKKDNSKIVELREQTMMERYGVRHALDSDEFKQKAKNTCRENHGVDYPMQSTDVMEKSRQTSKENWGTERPQQSEKYKAQHYPKALKEPSPKYSELSTEEQAAIQAERSERRQQTNLERYGVKSPSQVPEFREKARKTTLERYGDEEFFRTDSFKEKSLETSRERYGTDSPMQSDVVKAKARQTTLERYGTSCSLQNPEVQEKAKQTNIEKFSELVPMRSNEIKQKHRETFLERYGIENPSQIPEVVDKRKSTNRQRYGTDYYGQQHIEHLDEWNDKELFIAACKNLQATLGRKPHINELMAYFNVQQTSAYNKVHAYDCLEYVNMQTSYIEDKWRSWLVEEGIPCSDRPVRVLDGDGSHLQEIDIFIPKYSLGLEIDPTSTHNSSVPYYNNSQPKSQLYHQKKTKAAEEAGINLVHIYDFLDELKMKSIIKSLCHQNMRLYARMTTCEPVKIADEKAFLEKYHLQGYVKSEKSYGLFTADDAHELVAIMTFGKPRYGTQEEKQIRWELLRFCSKDQMTVVGGASKLFAAFVKENMPESVLSYANYDISNGKMYDALGFKYKRTTNPSYTWVKLGDPSDTYSWFVVNSKGFDNLFGTNYGKGTSNIQLMEEAGYVRVYNSGNKVYIWTPTGC